MKKIFLLFIFALTVCLSAAAQKKISDAELSVLNVSPELQTLVDRAANDALARFSAKGLKTENLAVTLIDLRDANNLKWANFRGEEKIYPASVVKMFYLAAVHEQLKEGKLKDSPELRRALKDMIVDSYNDATQFVVDVLTGTANGAELSPQDLKKYAEKRDWMNRYFARLGYSNINVNQKTYCEDLYGRERQFWNAGKNRNMLTTGATARLLAEIALGRAVDAEHSRQMLELLRRDFSGAAKDNDDQAHGFSAIALNELNLTDAKLWSKAGWTSTARHDAAYIETPDGLKFVLVVFTSNVANERDIIPSITRTVLENLGKIKN